MRNMDFEKEYKDMVQRARELHESGNALTKLQMEIVCPALAESEDERIRKELLEVIRHCYEDGGYALCTDDYKKYSAYLEKQKEQKPTNSEKPKEWSEEDEKTISDAYCWLAEYAGFIIGENKEKATMLFDLAKRLKSLRPKPHWKPSEEQMDHLAYAYTQLKLQKCYAPHVYESLGSLYDDLKKHFSL